MHDNAVAKAMMQQGCDIQLVPTYTPIRTDEEDVSVDQVFFGGINVFLQQKIPLLRLVPGFLDRFLDNAWLIRKATSRSTDMKPETLGALTVSMLKGSKGNQRKEVNRLCRWLAEEQPDVVLFTNALIVGCIPEIKRRTSAKVWVTLQGDDVFLDSLPKNHRQQCIDSISRIANDVDGFVTHSQFYKNRMSEYFSIPLEKIHVTRLGLDLTGFESAGKTGTDGVVTIGYLARLAHEKGFHHLVDAFVKLKQQPATEHIRLRAAGWLGDQNKAYAQENFDKLAGAGLSDAFEYIGQVTREEKIEFLRGVDVLCVPTEFLEPKALYALEAMAMGIPVVEPNHGCFPELIESTGGGLLYDPSDMEELKLQLFTLANDSQQRTEIGRRGQEAVQRERSAAAMAVELAQVLFGKETR